MVTSEDTLQCLTLSLTREGNNYNHISSVLQNIDTEYCYCVTIVTNVTGLTIGGVLSLNIVTEYCYCVTIVTALC